MSQNLDSRDWYKREQTQLAEEIEKIRAKQRDDIIHGIEERKQSE